VLELLERAGYVDDLRFARARAEQLAARGYGDEWIRADLDAQGVEAEAVAGAVAELEPEFARARQQWRRLAGGAAAARTLARRGFTEETVEALLAKDPARGVG
jgi:SOS response regulatory protein OraA/RecX